MRVSFYLGYNCSCNELNENRTACQNSAKFNGLFSSTLNFDFSESIWRQVQFIQERQFAYNVTLRRVRDTNVAVEKL